MWDKLKVCLFVACVYWLPPCYKTQSDYELTVSRPFPQSNRNNLRLNCNFIRDSMNIQNARYWLNDTQQELKQLLGEGNYLEESNGFGFIITRELEGNYFCAPDLSTTPSQETPIIAYPLDEVVQPEHKTALAGGDVVLSPLISPGALLSQYFIDWRNGTNMETLAIIQGPRIQQSSFIPDERFSVDPDTFELTIQSVRFEDRGSYLGAIGVMDPAGMEFTYSQTESEAVMLEVYVAPSFITPPPDSKVVSSMTSSTCSFTCTVEGYPRPAIAWYHNTVAVDNGNKYRIQERVISEDPFVVESTLTIMSLSSYDSGGVSCNATVRTPEGDTFPASRKTLLSVLGELNRVIPFVTVNREVILRVNLARPIPAEIQLLIKYRERGTGRVTSFTTRDRYSQSDEITYFDKKIPYEQFTVDVALVSGNQMGPLHVGMEMHHLYQPTELHPILMNFVLPSAIVVVAILIIGILVIIGLCIGFCHKPCLECCFHINPKGSQAAIINKKIDLNKVMNKINPPSDRPPNAAGGVPFPGGGAQTDSAISKRNCVICLKSLCSETEQEKEAKKTLGALNGLLQGADNDTSSNGERTNASVTSTVKPTEGVLTFQRVQRFDSRKV